MVMTQRLPSTSLRLALSLAVLAGASVLGGCRPIRAYEPCSINADCPAGTQCLEITTDRDRMCTAGCTSDASCPLDRFGSNGRCLSFNGGADFSCWQACAAGGGGSECPFGYDCLTTDGTSTFPPICLPVRAAPTPTQRPYESCATTSECQSATECLSINTRGDRMCTDFCTTDASCPADRYGYQARCMSFDGGGTFTCWQACQLSAGGAECAPGYGCFDSDGSSSFPPICLPR
jgi:hypothetical protein